MVAVGNWIIFENNHVDRFNKSRCVRMIQVIKQEDL